MPVLDNYLNVHEAAEVLGVHWETVKRICREGRMPARKVHNMWLINKDDLALFAATYDEPRRGKRRKVSSLRIEGDKPVGKQHDTK